MSKTHSDIQFDHNGFAVLFASAVFLLDGESFRHRALAFHENPEGTGIDHLAG